MACGCGSWTRRASATGGDDAVGFGLLADVVGDLADLPTVHGRAYGAGASSWEAAGVSTSVQSSWAWPPQCEGQWLLGLVIDLPASCGPASSKGLRPGKLYARPARRPPGRVVFWHIFAGTVLLCHCWCHEVFGCAGAPGQGRWPEDHYVTRVRVIAPDQQSLVPHLDEPNITHRLETHAQK